MEDAGVSDAGSEDAGVSDAGAEDAGVVDAEAEDAGVSRGPLRGRFTSSTPIRRCDEVSISPHIDGQLVRTQMDICGDDMAALARTLRANLDALEEGKRAILVINQGPSLPTSIVEGCQSFPVEFALGGGEPTTEDFCVPWDERYQADLRAALQDEIAPMVDGHPALVGVYFAISTMTNGVEMHMRIPRADLPAEPNEGAFTQAYLDVMDIYQEAFSVPILFEAGHCIFDVRGAEGVDCETPLALYRHTRDTYGVGNVGVALWNCAERFWVQEDSQERHVLPLLLEATADGVGMGCQTVGNFTRDACRFSDTDVGDFGTSTGGLGGGNCDADAPSFDPEGACVSTMRWFAGELQSSEASPRIVGTWTENWNQDVQETTGIYYTSDACRAAIDHFAAE